MDLNDHACPSGAIFWVLVVKLGLDGTGNAGESQASLHTTGGSKLTVKWLGNWWNTTPDEETVNKIQVLNEVKLFENARREDLIGIAEKSEFREMNADETIIHGGDPGEGMYIIDSGSVCVYHKGTQEEVALFSGGDYFGEMALLENKPRSADVVCERDGRLLFFSKKGFHELLQGNPKTAGKFLFVLSRTLSRRLRRSNQELRIEKNNGTE